MGGWGLCPDWHGFSRSKEAAVIYFNPLSIVVLLSITLPYLPVTAAWHDGDMPSKSNWLESFAQARQAQLDADPFLQFKESDAARNKAQEAESRRRSQSFSPPSPLDSPQPVELWANRDESTAVNQAGNAFRNYQEQVAYDETLGRGRELLGQSKGLYDAALNDPTDRYVMERLREMSDPSKTQAALFTQGADQAAAASGARWQQQQESLAMRGVTPQSGSYQAAQNQNLASRQQDVQRARLNSNLAGTQQASQALSQMGNQQQAQFGRKQQALDTYGNALKTPVGVRPGTNTNTGNAPQINSGSGATYNPIAWGEFSREWAKANNPAPKQFGR